MIKAVCAFTLFATTSLYAGTSHVTSTDPVKTSMDSKKAIYINDSGTYGCPDGFDLYVRASKPEQPKDSKDKEKTPPPQGDWDSFYFAKSANPAQPAIIVSRPGMQEYTPACLQVK